MGKSTVAAGLAVAAASRGKRVLLCDVDPAGDVGTMVGAGDLDFEARPAGAGLWALAVHTEEALQEYLRLYLHVPAGGRTGVLARVFDFVAAAAPGVREILTVGKIAWEVRQRHYDLVVVDAPASGHVVSLLDAPHSIRELVSTGPVRAQAGWMAELLADPVVTGLVVVATPEEMPVNETVELVRRVSVDTAVDVAAVVVNRVLPELFIRSDEEVFDRLGQPSVVEELEAAGGTGVGTMLEAARLALRLRRAGAVHVQRLSSELKPACPLLFVPYLFAGAGDRAATEAVAEALASELGR